MGQKGTVSMKTARGSPGAGSYRCMCCLRTSPAGAYSAAALLSMCPECYELTSIEELASGGRWLGVPPSEALATIARVESLGGDPSVWADLKTKAERAAEGGAA